MPRSTRTASEIAFGKALGKQFAAARAQKDYSSDGLARLTGVSVDAIRSIETGRTLSPGLYLSARLTMHLGVSLDTIVHKALEEIATTTDD